MAASTKTRQRTKTAHAKTGKREEFVRDHKDLRLLGEVITWQVKTDSVKHNDVVNALVDAGLDDKLAREMLPKHAFTRAAKKLTEDRVIDVLRDEADTVTFQFTKRALRGDEWKYEKETLLVLDKVTGKIKCDNDDLRKFAQGELDRCIEARTASDVTKIVQKLFGKEADLFPLRDQGGVYFVPNEHVGFTEKVGTFLDKLGGRLLRFPVPRDTRQGDQAVQDAVAGGLQELVAEHERAIADFDLSVRPDTFVRVADRIHQTRVKVEAYASYLDEKREELLAAVDEAKRKLKLRVDELTATRAANPQLATNGGGNRGFICGFSVTAVIRWMGRNGWAFADVRRVVDSYVGDGIIADGTLRCQIAGGRCTDPESSAFRGEPAPLTDEQVAELNQKREELRPAV